MRRSVVLASCGLLLGSPAVSAQYSPPGLPPQVPAFAPRPPASASPPQSAVSSDGSVEPGNSRPEIALPYPERKVSVDSGTLNLKRFAGGWQLWSGTALLREFGNAETEAREALRALRDLHVDEWASIGGPRPVVEYGLRGGRATVAGGLARVALPIDLRTVRAESTRGVWLLRDDETVHFNFGTSRADAEQAAAVVRKYGFDRVGVVGYPNPVMAFLYVAVPGDRPPSLGLGALGRQAQIDALTRTGIPVPGLGFVGEMVKIDPRQVEVRRVGYEWSLAHGPDVLARFGAGEWAARDALRIVRDGRFTEWCRFGTPGTSFFLADGKAPTRAPFSTIVGEFEPSDLKARQVNGKWTVAAGGRPLFEVASAEEGAQLIRLLQHFGFDRVCRAGDSPRACLSFLSKSR